MYVGEVVGFLIGTDFDFLLAKFVVVYFLKQSELVVLEEGMVYNGLPLLLIQLSVYQE
jgi:hypothetical protein